MKVTEHIVAMPMPQIMAEIEEALHATVARDEPFRQDKTEPSRDNNISQTSNQWRVWRTARGDSDVVHFVVRVRVWSVDLGPRKPGRAFEC